MAIVEEKRFNLICKTLTGDEHVVQVKASQTLNEVRQLVSQKADCDPKSIMLLKGAKFLKDGTKALVDYGITEDTKLKTVIRLSSPVIPYEEHLGINSPRCLALTPDDRYTACGTYQSKLFIFNTETGEKIYECKPHEGTIRKLEFNKKGNRLVTGGADSCAKLFSFNGRELNELKCFRFTESVRLWAAGFSNCEQYVAAGGRGCNKVIMFDIETAGIYKEFDHTQGISSISLTNDTRLIAAGGSDGYLSIWDIQTGTLKHNIHAHGCKDMWRILFSKDGTRLFTLGVLSCINMWDPESGEQLKTFEIKSYDFKLMKNDQFLVYQCNSSSGLYICNVDDDEADFNPTRVMELNHCEQMTHSHMKNTFIASTNSNVHYVRIPEEIFFGAL